jgi:hypothetical protein
MKLIEVALQAPRGSYFGLHPTKETIEAMQEFMKEHHVPNPLENDKLHSTVVFSRTFCGARPLGKLDPTWQGQFTAFDIFPSGGPADDDGLEESDKPRSNCLVLKFDCPELHERHHFLRKHHGATHDFPSFEPHMTLSYNVGDFDHQNLPHYDGPHEFDEEYSEPLNLNWVK